MIRKPQGKYQDFSQRGGIIAEGDLVERVLQCRSLQAGAAGRGCAARGSDLRRVCCAMRLPSCVSWGILRPMTLGGRWRWGAAAPRALAFGEPRDGDRCCSPATAPDPAALPA